MNVKNELDKNFYVTILSLCHCFDIGCHLGSYLISTLKNSKDSGQFEIMMGYKELNPLLRRIAHTACLDKNWELNNNYWNLIVAEAESVMMAKNLKILQSLRTTTGRESEQIAYQSSRLQVEYYNEVFRQINEKFKDQSLDRAFDDLKMISLYQLLINVQPEKFKKIIPLHLTHYFICVGELINFSGYKNLVDQFYNLIHMLGIWPIYEKLIASEVPRDYLPNCLSDDLSDLILSYDMVHSHSLATKRLLGNNPNLDLNNKINNFTETLSTKALSIDNSNRSNAHKGCCIIF